jgi:hypothetical protein
MEIIRGQLSGRYIQHEAIEAQKQLVNSQNHTVVYIPVGPMGVPIAGTFPTTATQGPGSRGGGPCQVRLIDYNPRHAEAGWLRTPRPPRREYR